MGLSGCRKTNTLDLQERFYDSTSGRIEIDEEVIPGDATSYLNLVSLVALEPTLYTGIIAESQGLGAATTSPPPADEEIIQTSQDAYIPKFITFLPDGHHTVVGAKGMGLSWGQGRHVAIAHRLSTRQGADVTLVFDEGQAVEPARHTKLVKA